MKNHTILTILTIKLAIAAIVLTPMAIVIVNAIKINIKKIMILILKMLQI
jgi:hypothetical protein